MTTPTSEPMDTIYRRIRDDLDTYSGQLEEPPPNLTPERHLITRAATCWGRYSGQVRAIEEHDRDLHAALIAGVQMVADRARYAQGGPFADVAGLALATAALGALAAAEIAMRHVVDEAPDVEAEPELEEASDTLH